MTRVRVVDQHLVDLLHHLHGTHLNDTNGGDTNWRYGLKSSRFGGGEGVPQRHEHDSTRTLYSRGLKRAVLPVFAFKALCLLSQVPLACCRVGSTSWPKFPEYNSPEPLATFFFFPLDHSSCLQERITGFLIDSETLSLKYNPPDWALMIILG